MALLSKRLANWRNSMVASYVYGDVMDVACGNAIVLKEYNHLLDSYLGIEFDQQTVNRLGVEFPKSVFLQIDLDKDAIVTGKKFDVV